MSAMTETPALFMHRIQTPIGGMEVVTDGEGRLRATGWVDLAERMQRLLRIHYGERGSRVVAPRGRSQASEAIERYFAGELAAIEGLAVATAGTPFQRAVWRALRGIRVGTTASYAEIARRIGRPKAVRAVGLANGANPIGVVVPCHRVIGADGSLTGYGGGMERKRWLLEHERGAGRP